IMLKVCEECGNEFKTYPSIANKKRHCSQHCLNVSRGTELTGKRFGRLVVLNLDYIDHRGRWMWNCICDCGNSTTVRATHLRSENTKSCGCLAAELTRARSALPTGEHARRDNIKRYKFYAEKRGIYYGLTNAET